MKKPTVTVVGSINMDLTTRTKRVPEQGETVLGLDFAIFPGGKGANQAVSAARLGAKTIMIGAVGADGFGEQLISNLKKENVMTDFVKSIDQRPTGTATILLSDGDNRIIVSPGANNSLTPETIEKHRKVIANSDVLLLQLEIPMETVEKAAEVAKENQVITILNPAPYQPLPESLLRHVDYITPNENEAERLLHEAKESLVKPKLVITKGKDGVAVYNDDTEILIPAHPVKVVDTTGAGDSFNGALAYKLGQGETMIEAVKYANAVAALSITRLGAQAGMPTSAEVEAFLNRKK